MKKVLIPIVTATLLACGSAAADVGSPDSCAGNGRNAALSRLSDRAVPPSGCVDRVHIQFVRSAQKFLSDKELERALKRQLRGRLIDARLNERRVEYTVLWEEQQGGKRKLRKLIVDAKTGRVKREIRGGS